MYNSRKDEHIMFVGDVKNPIAIGKKKDLWANLDNEFYAILELWSWHTSGLIPIDITKITYSQALGVRYLIDREKQRGY